MNTGSQKTQMEAKVINYQKLLAIPLAMVILGSVFVGSALASTTQAPSSPRQAFLSNLSSTLGIDQATSDTVTVDRPTLRPVSQVKSSQDVAANPFPINSLVNAIVVNSAAGEQATNNSQVCSSNIVIVVSTSIPERLKVYKNGFVIFTARVNTGVPAAPTPHGTFYVSKKLVTETMSGVNPDGSHYFDPGVPWVMYFFYGCAIHGFVRSQYGFAQSVGCVEMRPSKAQKLFPLIPVGTKVIIEE
jgi:lipoprotein-anchoring transpeptidase ErfK/SrfK